MDEVTGRTNSDAVLVVPEVASCHGGVVAGVLSQRKVD